MSRSGARSRNHTNPFKFHEPIPPLSLQDLFGSEKRPLDIDIGFGRGQFLAHWSKLHPERCMIGVEVRRVLFEAAQKKFSGEEFPHVHVVHNSAENLLTHGLKNALVDRVFIFHPDPWMKRAHHKRRIIRPSVLELLHQRMRKKGKLYLSTDVGSLWADLREVMTSSPWFKPIEDTLFWEEVYHTHWATWSEKTQRTCYQGCFEHVHEAK